MINTICWWNMYPPVFFNSSRIYLWIVGLFHRHIVIIAIIIIIKHTHCDASQPPYCIDWHVDVLRSNSQLYLDLHWISLIPKSTLIIAQRPGVIFLRRNLTPGSFFYVGFLRWNLTPRFIFLRRNLPNPGSFFYGEIRPRVIFLHRNLTIRSIFYGGHFSPWYCRINSLVRFWEKWSPLP
jgi:hypothetical protein